MAVPVWQKGPPLYAIVAVGVDLTLTLTLVVAVPQELVKVYTTLTIPAVTPVNTPFWSIVAVPVPFWTDQTPPAVVFVNGGVDCPTQTAVEPPPIVETVALGIIVTLAVAVFEQPLALKL